MKETIKKKVSDLSIRPAKSEDIETLINLCRDGFPGAIVWQAPRFLARKRWENILSLTAVETWVCSLNGEVVGFSVLASDMVSYARKKRKLNGGFIRRACNYVFCPKLCLVKVLRKIRTFPRDCKQNFSGIKKEITSINALWIEPIAIASRMRGKGFGKELIRHCEHRAFELHKDAIKVSVNPMNTLACNVYEKLGFACTNRVAHNYIYTRKVNGTQSDNKDELCTMYIDKKVSGQEPSKS
ncbi:MAG: GNAT family N-acetyltransferase [Planctomycetota bacterium]|jgi:ribosomal protein S18 acetylase RimI-like enzyme